MIVAAIIPITGVLIGASSQTWESFPCVREIARRADQTFARNCFTAKGSAAASAQSCMRCARTVRRRVSGRCEGKRHGERRALPLAFADGLDGSAMEFDDVAR